MTLRGERKVEIDDGSLGTRVKYPEAFLPYKIREKLFESRINTILGGGDAKRVKGAVEKSRETLRQEGVEPIYAINGNPCRPVEVTTRLSTLHYLVGLDGKKYRIDDKQTDEYIARLQDKELLPKGNVKTSTILIHIGYYRKNVLPLGSIRDSYPPGTQERERFDLDRDRIYSKDIGLVILVRDLKG